MMAAHVVTWTICGLATAGVIARPWMWPEAIWPCLGAGVLVICRLLSLGDAVRGVGRGIDVYLFLIGMMLLAELARREGVFDWLAGQAARAARGSARRLFALVYLVGVVVTVFLSNDATAVVLTPAVLAVVRAVKAERPLPYLMACAFTANAASFVLPISNPANLVIYGHHLPSLLQWLPRYGLSALASIAVTYVVLGLTQWKALKQEISSQVDVRRLSRGGKVVALGIVATAMVLMAAWDRDLGPFTFGAGVVVALVVLVSKRQRPWSLLRGISFGVLPLVAGLFVLVEALDKTGVLGLLVAALRYGAHRSPEWTQWASGGMVALACNVMNNLPVGLIAGHAVQAAQVSPWIAGAILIGVDVGPTLSVTGSLSTIIWLSVLRREGQDVSGWQFLKLGAWVMPPAVLLAIAALR